MPLEDKEFGKILRREMEKAGVECDERLCQRLERFAGLLREWNATHNLTGDDRAEAIVANLVDTLRPLSFVERPDTLLDVGTGAGFPGLILAAAWPGTQSVLCEPRMKRAAFLRFAALELGLENVEVARRRVEEVRHSPFGLITSRAVSRSGLLLELTRRLSDASTRYLFYKGNRLEDEFDDLPETLERRVVDVPPRRYLYLVPKKSAES